MPGIGQWLSALHDARYVVTDSFHACAFCILFHKPFAVYINRRRGSARIRSLLEQFGLEGRIASPGKPLAQTLDAPIDWEAVERTLEERRADSRGFLALHLQEAPAAECRRRGMNRPAAHSSARRLISATVAPT